MNDEAHLKLATLRYSALRVGLRVLHGKQKRTELLNQKGIRPTSLLLKDSVVLTRNGITARVRKNSTDYEQMFVEREKPIQDLLNYDGLNPGETFVDVGANVGSYSIQIGKLRHPVVAIEADLETFKVLQENISLNNLNDNITAYNLAAWSGRTVLTLYRKRGYDACSSLFEQTDKQTEVKTDTLDNLLQDTQKLVLKIDVEGAELEVLKGATETLEKCRLVIVECHSQELVEGVEHLLRPLFRDIQTRKDEGSSVWVIAK